MKETWSVIAIPWCTVLSWRARRAKAEDTTVGQYGRLSAIMSISHSEFLSVPATDVLLDFFSKRYPGDIPQGTAVPRWAFFNVTRLPDTLYDDNNAKSVGRDPEAFPKPQNTLTGGPTATGSVNDTSSGGGKTATKPQSTLTEPGGPTSTSAVNNTSSSGKKTVAIVGGVVGGVSALIIVSIIIFFAVRHARRNKDKNTQPQHQYEESTDHWKRSPVSPTYDPSISTGPTVVSKGPVRLYRPGDPSTFPPAILMEY
jgi:hypothetical protein